jgi:hypothetical protein
LRVTEYLQDIARQVTCGQPNPNRSRGCRKIPFRFPLPKVARLSRRPFNRNRNPGFLGCQSILQSDRIVIEVGVFDGEIRDHPALRIGIQEDPSARQLGIDNHLHRSQRALCQILGSANAEKKLPVSWGAVLKRMAVLRRFVDEPPGFSLVGGNLQPKHLSDARCIRDAKWQSEGCRPAVVADRLRFFGGP